MLKKIIVSIILGTLSASFFATYSSASMAQSIRDDVLRLHVIANSDSEYDQSLKLKVRDAILRSSSELFLKASDKSDAWDISGENLDVLKEIALKELNKNGCHYDVKVSLGESFFPTKVYDNGYRLPAGFYDALKVEIGEARGKNWWCILYPPLCLAGASEKNDDVMSDILEDEELEFVKVGSAEGVQIKFKLAEWWGLIMERFS